MCRVPSSTYTFFCVQLDAQWCAGGVPLVLSAGSIVLEAIICCVVVCFYIYGSLTFMMCAPHQSGHIVAQLVETRPYNTEGRGFESLEFFIYMILRAAIWPWGRLSL